MSLMISYRGCQGQMILDSVSDQGIRLPTIHLRYPRMVHSELMTHRVLTRNGRSSRAVPVITMMEEARFPYIPHFMKNEPGMSATQEFTPEEFAQVEAIWRELAEFTRLKVMELQQLQLHKQWANRPLEWFGYIDVLVSSTYIENFKVLRMDATAQPEMRNIAQVIIDLLEQSVPTELKPGEWHMPYIDLEKDAPLVLDFLQTEEGWSLPGNHPTTQARIRDTFKKLSTARCARLSYAPFDGNGDVASEISRHDRLVVSRPVHASPAEHVATPDSVVQTEVAVIDGEWTDLKSWEHPKQHGNFCGWRQYRKMLPNEAVMEEFPLR